MNRSRLILVLVILGVVCGAVWLTMRLTSASRGRPNVVLISIDTCRADHLSCYGRFQRTTPHIDAVAAEGVLFENVIAQVPITLPSHSSMLTGTIPPYHRVHDNLHYQLADDNVTIAERLGEHGYRTGAVIGSFVLDSQFGTAQGFDTYNDDFSDTTLEIMGGQPERLGESVTKAGIEWLDEHASEKFFLFLHYYDPHLPYRPPGRYASLFADNLYKGEIAYTDECIGRVVAKLKDLGLYDSTLLVITADHGEGLGDHGEALHGYFIYHSTTKVPLIVKLPGKSEPRRIREKASLVDIVPTILAQVGLPLPEDVQGLDLTSYLSGVESAKKEKRFLYSESMVATKYGCGSLLGLETDRWKYIQTTEPELYDLEADPGEERNIAAEQPQRAEHFQERLKAMLQEYLRTDSDRTKVTLDPQSLERLGALGYIGGAVVEAFEFDTSKPDPKDFLDVFTKIEGMHYSLNNNDLARARRYAEEILAERPDLAYVHEKLGKVAFGEGNVDEAILHFSEAIRLGPARPELHNDLGVLLTRQGRRDEAIEQYREALRLSETENPDDDNLDRLLVGSGRGRPVVSNVRKNLGLALSRQDKLEEAIEEFRLAVEADSGNAEAHFLLGNSLGKLGRFDEATKALEEALRLKPDHEAARRVLEGLRSKAPASSTP